ncbi:MAG: C40 family peptidase [Gammaproteobacteria bacterium]|nr:C40 family peptidase [Gammaproteobacteria bacterium]
MKFHEKKSSPDQRLGPQGRLFAGVATALLLAFLSGCGSSEAYRAPVEHRGTMVNGHASPSQANRYQAAEAPRTTGHGPNYDMAMVAKEMVGVRYRYGGNSPSSGFDCSGLIYYSYKRIGLRSPRTTRDLYRHARPVNRSELRTGDILFFRLDGKKVSHAAIYLGNGRMVHAPSSGKRVSYASLRSRFWRNRFIGAGRLY